MERFSFVTSVTGLNRRNTGKEDDDDDALSSENRDGEDVSIYGYMCVCVCVYRYFDPSVSPVESHTSFVLQSALTVSQQLTLYSREHFRSPAPRPLS
jgi:hypothetical protein